MRIVRFIITSDGPPPAPGTEIFLPPAEARHGILSLRLKPGRTVELVGPWGLAPAEVSLAERQNLKLGVTVTGPWQGEASKPVGPCLAVALIQNQRFDWIVEKAVELGAVAIIPLVTERVKSGLAESGPNRAARWRRLADEARKQCGRAHSLTIFKITSLAKLLEDGGQLGEAAFDRRIFLSLSGCEFKLDDSASASTLIVVGPEGGLTEPEEGHLLTAGFKPWRLGKTVLRAETAALAALARLMF